MAVQKAPISPLLPAMANAETETSSTAPRELADYVAAATRENTRRSYASAIQHFEHTWGGFLPASAEHVAQYLVAHAEQLAFNTLKQRLAALSHWHQEHGFHDPTRANPVRQVLKGIKALHPSVERRAKPLHLKDLAQAMAWLTRAATLAQAHGEHGAWLRHLRDRALLALGFWRGFRGDELLRLQVEHLQWVPGEGLRCYLPRSKTDRSSSGVTFHVPALSVCCPVAATKAWIDAASITQGPLFRRVERWGSIGETPLHANSLIRLLRAVLQEAGVSTPDAYSAHSLRRGFATWATTNGWDIKALMEYVGWKDMKSALRYFSAADPFGRERIEQALSDRSNEPKPSTPVSLLVHDTPAVSTRLHVELRVTSTRGDRRAAHRARQRIETVCLASHGAQRLDASGTHYEIELKSNSNALIEETIGELEFDTRLALHQWQERAAGLEHRVAERDVQLKSLEDKYAHAHETLNHFRHGAKEQRDQELRRHEHERQSVQVELRHAQESLAGKAHDLLQLNRDNERLTHQASQSESKLRAAQLEVHQHRQQLEKLTALEHQHRALESKWTALLREQETVREQLIEQQRLSSTESARRIEAELQLARSQARLEALEHALERFQPPVPVVQAPADKATAAPPLADTTSRLRVRVSRAAWVDEQRAL